MIEAQKATGLVVVKSSRVGTGIVTHVGEDANILLWQATASIHKRLVSYLCWLLRRQMIRQKFNVCSMSINECKVSRGFFQSLLYIWDEFIVL